MAAANEPPPGPDAAPREAPGAPPEPAPPHAPEGELPPGGDLALEVGEGTVVARRSGRDTPDERPGTRRIPREAQAHAEAGAEHWRGTLLAAIREAVRRWPERPAIRARKAGKWEAVTFQALWRRVGELTMGLRNAGVTKDDRVLVVAANGPEIVYAELAAVACRALSAVLHPRYTTPVLRHVLESAQPRVAIVESGEPLARYLEAREHVAERVKVISFGDGVPGPRGEVRKLSAILAEGRRRIERCRAENLPDPFEQLVERTRPSDAVAVAFTSGTTGPPRGAVMGHENAVAGDFPLLFGTPTPDDVGLVQMPFSQPFARFTVAYQLLAAGASIAFPGTDARLIDALAAYEPTMLFLGAGTLEPLEREIKGRVLEQNRLGRWLTDWALGKAREARGDPGRRLPWYVDRFILSRIRQHLGGRIRFVYIGGAADGHVLSFFQDAGIDTYEGYAVTEATPLVALSRPEAGEEARFGEGVAGRPLPGVQVRSDEDGEILVRGLANMRGYWRDEAGSEAALLEDGWLRTGDLGYIDKAGQVVLQDRRGDAIQLADGTLVCPAPVEAALKAGSSLIREIVLVGRGRPFPVALVLPDWKELAARVYRAQPELARAARRGQLLANPASRVAVESEVLARAAALPTPRAAPRKVRLISMAFTTQTELSPTGALRRDALEDRYRHMIDALYEEAAAEEAAERAVPGAPAVPTGAETQEMRGPAFSS
jgi:long-chain acyl-CoA synthetase